MKKFLLLLTAMLSATYITTNYVHVYLCIMLNEWNMLFVQMMLLWTLEKNFNIEYRNHASDTQVFVIFIITVIIITHGLDLWRLICISIFIQYIQCRYLSQTFSRKLLQDHSIWFMLHPIAFCDKHKINLKFNSSKKL